MRSPAAAPDREPSAFPHRQNRSPSESREPGRARGEPLVGGRPQGRDRRSSPETSRIPLPPPGRSPTCPSAQDFGERIIDCPFLSKGDNSILVHGVTLHLGGSGGLITNPVTPPSSPPSPSFQPWLPDHVLSRISQPFGLGVVDPDEYPLLVEGVTTAGRVVAEIADLVREWRRSSLSPRPGRSAKCPGRTPRPCDRWKSGRCERRSGSPSWPMRRAG